MYLLELQELHIEHVHYIAHEVTKSNIILKRMPKKVSDARNYPVLLLDEEYVTVMGKL